MRRKVDPCVRISCHYVSHDFPNARSQSVCRPFCCAELFLQRTPPQMQIAIETRQTIRKESVEIEPKATAREVGNSSTVEWHRMFTKMLVKLLR